MAPSPENDNTPKAPDKTDKSTKYDPQETAASVRNVPADNKLACVSKLNDGELKALLDEAINYKNPKDRVGKSDIFMNLLLEAEEEERNVRAERAVGSKLVRYCNPSAKKRHHSRHKREPSSVSENLTHGGSLNNLAKEELYEGAGQLQRPRKSVSARQREGGSLPCNVNVGIPPANYDKQFFEEVRRKQTQKSGREYAEVDMETESLLEHDSLDRDEVFGEQAGIEMVQTRIPRVPLKFTTSATLQVGNVDDSVLMPKLEASERSVESAGSQAADQFHARMYPSTYNLLIPGPHFFNRTVEDKKVDENGNALAHSGGGNAGAAASDLKKAKKKKTQTEKNVVVKSAKDVVGHRGDIINDVDKLNEYICGAQPKTGGGGGGAHKSKLHKHMHKDAEDRQQQQPTSKKQRTRSKGGGKASSTGGGGGGVTAGALQKSNSLDEMSSSAKLEELADAVQVEMMARDSDGKVALRPTKSNAERPRERRSWGNTEQLQLYSNISVENLETAEFRVVTKKKKSKKQRRNSISSAHNRQQRGDFNNRVPSPELRRKSACSVPHSEKSNDSSDVDSVHSLPVDAGNGRRSEDEHPISYADIAKNSSAGVMTERPPVKWKGGAGSPEAERGSQHSDAKLPQQFQQQQELVLLERVKPQAVTQGVQTSPKLQHAAHVERERSLQAVVLVPPDVHNIHNFPSIQHHYHGYHHHHQQQQQQFSENNNNNRVVMTVNSSKQSAKVYKNSQNNFIRNLKNSSVCADDVPTKATQITIGALHLVRTDISRTNDNQLPPNVPDVRTIEKIHFARMNEEEDANNRRRAAAADCDNNGGEERPAVVIMSGDAATKDVSGLVFGFDVNEKLLSDDVFDSFTSRFLVPVKFNTATYNHDKIVNFIGQAWEDVVNGKFQYYADSS